MENKKPTKGLKKVKIISWIIGLIILILFIYAIVNHTVLKNQLRENLELQIETYGYIAVLIFTFILEISPQPFVSGLVPFATGVIFGLNIKILFVYTIIGVIASSLTAYFLGIKFGEKIVITIVGKKNYKKVHDFFLKYGKLGMLLLALTPIPYFPILAGIFKMNPSDFLLFAIIPRICHFFIFGYLIYLIF